MLEKFLSWFSKEHADFGFEYFHALEARLIALEERAGLRSVPAPTETPAPTAEVTVALDVPTEPSASADTPAV